MFRGYDVRAEFPQFSPEVAARLGAAFSNWAKAEPIVIGRDVRTTSPLLARAFAAGAQAAGSEVIDLGVTTTPLLAFGALEARAVGAMISASHNPSNFNGVKFVRKDGTDVSSDELAKIEKFSKSPVYTEWNRIGSEKKMDVSDSYLSKLPSASADLTVALDPGNGAACRLARLALERIGCTVKEINAEADGTFPGRSAEPSPENLSELQSIKGVDFAVALDGDGDRAVFLDEKGNFIRADYILLLLGQKRKAVATVNCTSLLEDYMDVTRCRIGRTFVTEELRKDSSIEIAGEWSGHFWFTEKFLFSDGILAAVKMAEFLSQKQTPLSELLAQFPKTFVHHTKIDCPEEKKLPLLSALKKRFPDSETTDGVKLKMDDGWVLVRKSNTEPVVRVSAEALSEKKAVSRAEKYGNLAAEELKSL